MRNSISTVEDIYPLSPMQAGMLFHALYDETSPVHFVQLTGEFQGNFKYLHFRRHGKRSFSGIQFSELLFPLKALRSLCR